MTTKHDIPFGRPDITDRERAAVMEVLNGHILTHGPQCKQFEADFAAFMGEEANAVSVSSCMAALHLASLYWLKPGDEVLVPALTHVATVHAIEWVGAKPIFVDPDPVTGNMAPEGIRAALTDKTKAISLVHFVGIPCDMTGIMAIAEERDLFVIEDCAIAIGSRHQGKHVGLFGNAGMFSYYPVKQMTTGEGGMFVSKDEKTAKEVATLRAFGVDRSYNERKIPGFYEVPTLGLNYRMSELQAALGVVQTARLPELLEARHRNFAALKEHLAPIEGLRILDGTIEGDECSHYCLSVVLEGKGADKRNDIVLALKELGVGTSIYYPQPVPRMKYYRDKYGYDEAKYPVAKQISDCSIALPVGPHLGLAEMKIIGDELAEQIRKVRA